MAGDYERAKQEYERIIHLTTGRLFYGDIYAKSFYMLGRICDLWKEADSGIVVVEEVKKRLAGLQKTP
jgi:hypothetical protein